MKKAYSISLFEFYSKAKLKVIEKGYLKEIRFVEKRRFSDITPYDFQREFAYVVCNSGMNNKVAEKIFKNYLEKGLVAIKHPSKYKAIKTSEYCFLNWFNDLKLLESDIDKLNYLETLPHIGKITKYHLARNLGLDVAKPDRHLIRIAEMFNYADVQNMCKSISFLSGDRIGTVDLILWRFSTIADIEYRNSVEYFEEWKKYLKKYLPELFK